MSTCLKMAMGLLMVGVSVLVAGCPRGATSAIATSNRTLNFDRTDDELTLEVWNRSNDIESLTITATPQQSWIVLSSRSITSQRPNAQSGDLDKKSIVVTVNRSALTVGEHRGSISFSAEGVSTTEVEIRVTVEYDAISFSNATLDFERSQLPRFLEVWNHNPDLDSFTLSVAPSNPWIVVNTQTVTSDAPNSATGPFDKQVVQVSIDRRQLAAGTHTGSIVFSATGVVTRSVTVSVISDGSTVVGALNVVSPEVMYSDPYLIDFSFSLQDANGDAVVEDPSAFVIDAREGADPVPSETGVHIQRGTARQLRVALVLDYTLSMQTTTGAIDAMEEAAKNTLLPALNEDALVSVTEFHRDDFAAMEVVPFTFDRTFISARIDAIQSEFVQGFYSASAMLDAVFSAAQTFDAEGADEEDRYIIVFTDGNDTSSQNVDSPNDVVNLAIDLGIRIYAINFGSNQIATDLEQLTTGTDGMLFTAATVSDLDDSFQRIVRDLDGQYSLRWASLSRGGNAVTPGFSLGLGENQVDYTAPMTFVPLNYVGNGVLQGKLRFVTSDNQTATTVFLRADYVPRFIRRFQITLDSANDFTVTAVDGDNDGLFAGWTMTESTDVLSGATVLNFQSPGDPIPFGTFGPMLRITYDTLLAEEDPLFSTVFVDNSIYDTTGGQSFVVEGYTNTPPPAL